jgi:hypothetical protein
MKKYGRGFLTMAECIEREATIKRIKEVYCVGCNSYNGVRCRACGIGDAIDMIEDAPTVDAVPVVHTRWAHLVGDEWCCPVCGFVITTEGSWDKPTKKYCEDCGAKMDGGDSDACVGSNDFCSYGERREG